jgi:hypothetical protein
VHTHADHVGRHVVIGRPREMPPRVRLACECNSCYFVATRP